MQVLEAEAIADFIPTEDTERRAIPIGINADSLQTWLLEALAVLHHTHGYLFDVRVDDQDHTQEMLRDGTVLGVITGQAKPIQGCNVEPLGAMRYQAIASSSFAKTYFADGLTATALSRAPLIVFDRKDDLQWRFIRRITRARVAPPVHYLPTSTGFVEAAALGLGWCLAPQTLTRGHVSDKRIVTLGGGQSLDVPLFWQYAAVQSRTLENVGRTLFDASRDALVR